MTDSTDSTDPTDTARRRLLAAPLALAAAPWLAPAARAQAVIPPYAGRLEDVPFVTTPHPVVEAILDLAGVGPADTLIDLGSGDGRIVIAAAHRGANGLGVEIDPKLVELATQRAQQAGVADRARFVQQDLYHTDLRPATVLTLYLLPDVNLALRPQILETLAPGTRVVSHDWDMDDWRPDRTVVVSAPDKPVGLQRFSRLHLWVVPARAAGRWRGRLDADAPAVDLAIEQRFQQADVWLRVGSREPQRLRGQLQGAGLQAGAGPRGAPLLAAKIDGERLDGELRFEGRPRRVSAQRAR